MTELHKSLQEKGGKPAAPVPLLGVSHTHAPVTGVHQHPGHEQAVLCTGGLLLAGPCVGGQLLGEPCAGGLLL